MRPFMKRVLCVLAILLAATAVFARGAAEDPDHVNLTFRQNDPPDETGGLFDSVDEFSEMHDRISVNVESVPWGDALDQFIRESHAGGGPDVLQLAFVWTADLGRDDLVMNLDSLIAADPPGAGLDGFLGTELGTVDGSIYGIPWTVDTFTIAYRPDLFEEAGISEFPDTWEEFFEAAVVLSEPAGQYGFGFPAGSGSDSGMWFLVNYYLWSHDKFLVEEHNGEWRIGVTEADIEEAMRNFNAFFESGASPRTLIGIDSWGNPELVGGLARGDFAMSFFPPATFRASQEQAGGVLETAMVPRGSVRRVSHLGGRALAINPNTDHPEEAWELLQHLISRDTFEVYPQFPAQVPALGELEFGPGEQGYADQLPHAITFDQYIRSPAPVSGMWAATNRHFGSVYSGERTPAQAASALIAELEELLFD